MRHIFALQNEAESAILIYFGKCRKAEVKAALRHFRMRFFAAFLQKRYRLLFALPIFFKKKARAQGFGRRRARAQGVC